MIDVNSIVRAAEHLRGKSMKKCKLLLWDIDGTILNFEEAERFAIRKGFA